MTLDFNAMVNQLFSPAVSSVYSDQFACRTVCENIDLSTPLFPITLVRYINTYCVTLSQSLKQVHKQHNNLPHLQHDSSKREFRWLSTKQLL
jgi:hypothetical protein